MTNTQRGQIARLPTPHEQKHPPVHNAKDPGKGTRKMRKPSHSEAPIQSMYQVETQTDPPTPYNTERPNPSKKAKGYNILPQLIAMCVIMAYQPSANALTLSFTLTTGAGTGTGTLTYGDTGTQDPSDGYTEYALTEITGTYVTQAITGVDPQNYDGADNRIELAPNGNILVDDNGISFDTDNGQYNVYYYSLQNSYGIPGTLVDTVGSSTHVSSFTASSPTTPVPFQAPLADAIPVIGSVLVLGALRKVRTFKNA
jgi:hypothetical protein